MYLFFFSVQVLGTLDYDSLPILSSQHFRLLQSVFSNILVSDFFILFAILFFIWVLRNGCQIFFPVFSCIYQYQVFLFFFYQYVHAHHFRPTVLSYIQEALCVCSVVSDSLPPPGLLPAKLLCPWHFSRQEYWSRLPCPPPQDLPDPGIKLRLLSLLIGRWILYHCAT